MIKHIVLFKLKAEATEEQIAAGMAGFSRLTGIIDELQDLEVQRDIVGRPVSATFGLISRFADRASLGRYLSHPDHVAAVDAIRPLIDVYLVLDYEGEV